MVPEKEPKPKDKKIDVFAEGKDLLDAYEFFRNPEVMQSMVEAVREVINSRDKEKPIRILGIGSGTGMLEGTIRDQLRQEGYNIQLITSDLLEAVITQSKIRDVFRLVADNKNLPIQDSAVDLVVARSVTHYEINLKNEKKVLEEVRRILKDGGFFVDQVPAVSSEIENGLFYDIHAILPKIMNLQTIEGTQKMLEEIFPDNVKQANSQTGKKLVVSKKDFVKRYEPKRDQYQSDNDFLKAQQEFQQKISKIINLIKTIPREQRPNIWVTEDDDFGWSVPYTIFLCKKTS